MMHTLDFSRILFHIKVIVVGLGILAVTLCVSVIWISWFQNDGYGVKEFAEPVPYVAGSSHIKPPNNNDIEVPCNLSAYKHYLDLNLDSPSIPTEYLQHCYHIIYNHVHKTGSRTNKIVLHNIAAGNNFSDIIFATTFGLGESKQKDFGKRMKAAPKGRFVFMTHVQFGDFRDFIPDVLYINMIRDPADHFVSNYFFHKYGSGQVPKDKPKSAVYGKPIEDCITTNCFKQILFGFGQTRFLCKDAECRKKDSYSVARILEHINRYHLFIGIYEEMENFYEILEFLLPHMYHGALAEFKEIGEAQHNRTKTARKDDIPCESKVLLHQKLETEHELYNILKHRFHMLLYAIRKIKSKTSTTAIDT